MLTADGDQIASSESYATLRLPHHAFTHGTHARLFRDNDFSVVTDFLESQYLCWQGPQIRSNPNANPQKETEVNKVSISSDVLWYTNFTFLNNSHVNHGQKRPNLDQS